jgi:hypothetical protein
MDTNWLSYVGAVTGIAGAVMGYVAFRRSGEMKALDLRLELGKMENEARAIVDGLPGLMDKANGSRINVLAATGLGRSGGHQSWDQAWKVDYDKVSQFPKKIREADKTSKAVSHAELEAMLLATHALRGAAGEVRDKYRATLAADDRQREQIAAANQARVPPAR